MAKKEPKVLVLQRATRWARFRKLWLKPQCSARELRSAAARSCAVRSLVETVKMMHNSSQNLLETLANTAIYRLGGSPSSLKSSPSSVFSACAQRQSLRATTRGPGLAFMGHCYSGDADRTLNIPEHILGAGWRKKDFQASKEMEINIFYSTWSADPTRNLIWSLIL
jgi:hypothetical protein